MSARPRPRPAHTQGTTRCAYSTDGSRLVTVGSNNTIRLYKTGHDGEPINIDDCQEQNVALAAGADFFVVGSEDGTVSLYSLTSAAFEHFLVRTSLPIRDVDLSSDGNWCAVASDELTVKVVHTKEITRLRYLREHNRPAKHVSFDPKGSLVAVSCTNGIIYIYSLTADQPELIRKIDGLIGTVDNDSVVSTKVVWHPDGRAFAVPTPTRDIQVVSKNDWEKQRCFSNGHLASMTCLAWSRNGAMLASASKDGKLLIWETKTQSVIQRHEFSNIIDLAWHPTANILSFTTTDGEAYIYQELLPDQFAGMLKLERQPAPFIHDPLVQGANAGGFRSRPDARRRARQASVESQGSVLTDSDGDVDEDDFVVDDDGAGYTSNKRGPPDDDSPQDEHVSKRARVMKPRHHESFQPGSTPWRGNRKYLCLNLIGFVWTVDQDSHHTVTVEFYDHEFQRDFHFTDTFFYDKACLNQHGTLFSSPPADDEAAVIFYRPHESWTQRVDWHNRLPPGEMVTAMSLSDSFVTVTTSANYVRIYTLFGMPYRVYRPKSTPMVSCASWRDYVMTVGNGPVGMDGKSRLLYTIENVKRDEVCQNEDTVALPEGATLRSVFFSDQGNPCIYDSTGTLLTLLHWRRPSGASWVPLLDTKLLKRLESGRKHETYYPIAVADDKFHCIILKGGEQYPYFPRPLLSEFDLCIPLTSKSAKKKKKKKSDGKEDSGENSGNEDGDKDEEEDENADYVDRDGPEAMKLKQQFLLKNVLAAQLQDLMESTTGSESIRSQLMRMELDMDKALLQLLAVECRGGEERGMRALELVQLMRNRTGRMVEAATKVAERYGLNVLGDKMRQIAQGDDDDDDDF